MTPITPYTFARVVSVRSFAKASEGRNSTLVPWNSSDCGASEVVALDLSLYGGCNTSIRCSSPPPPPPAPLPLRHSSRNGVVIAIKDWGPRFVAAVDQRGHSQNGGPTLYKYVC